MMILRPHAPRLFAAVGTLTLLAAAGLFASSRPAHTAGGPVPVTVANTVQNHDRDNPALQPVGVTDFVQTNDQTYATKTLYTVPPGKRLVLESVSAISQAPGDTAGYTVFVNTGTGTGRAVAVVTASPAAAETGGAYSAATQPVRQYADSNSPVFVQVYKKGSAGFQVAVSLSGYLVDTP